VPIADELAAATGPDLVFLDLRGNDRREVLSELARRIASARPQIAEDALLRGLEERERLGSTALGDGVAAPHCRVDGLAAPLVALGVHHHGIAYDAPDERAVEVFAVLATPASTPGSHLRLLAGIARSLRGKAARQRIVAATTPDEALSWLLGHSLGAAT